MRCMYCVRSNVWFACFYFHSSAIHRKLLKWPMKMRWHTHFQCARQTFKRITLYQAHSKRKLLLPPYNVAAPPTLNGKLSAIVLLRRYANRSLQNLSRSMLSQIPPRCHLSWTIELSAMVPRFHNERQETQNRAPTLLLIITLALVLMCVCVCMATSSLWSHPILIVIAGKS